MCVKRGIIHCSIDEEIKIMNVEDGTQMEIPQMEIHGKSRKLTSEDVQKTTADVVRKFNRINNALEEFNRQHSNFEGVVAQVLNENELIINRGSEHGIELHMKLAVMDDQRSVIDPITNEDLGVIHKEKIRVFNCSQKSSIIYCNVI